MSNTPVTRVAPSPSESVLVTLARAAMATRTGEQAVWPTLDLSVTGQRTFGDYELLEEIGRGGMGVVYRAHQCSLDREVAIKFIAAGIDDSLHVTRFLAEARSAARLVHPNIVPVYEVGSIDGLHYLSMPLMRGLSLADRLDKGPLIPEEALSLLLKLCDAIHYAHRLGLLHLDLKPANILIDEHQQPLVADFGLARHMDGQGGVDAQEVSGTPQYMAPEQILIKQYRLTHATDLYALGALLYRVLTGVSPHGGGQVDDVIRRAVAGRIRPPRELMASIGRDLDAVCMKCLELQPSDRYASVAALADDLRRVRDGLPVSVRRIGMIERMQRWFKREPKLAFATGGAILALVIGAGATTWQWREASAQRDIALAQRNAAESARLEAAGSAALGAFVYAHQKDEFVAKSMFEWLESHFADDKQQKSVLMAFARSLAEQDRKMAIALLQPVVSMLASDYREMVIAKWSASTQPGHGRMAALLAYPIVEKANVDARKQFEDVLDRALVDNSDDPLLWIMAATFCRDQCTHPEATQKLIDLEPDNAFAWLLRASTTDDVGLVGEYLHEATKRVRFDDHDGEFYLTLLHAYRDSGVPLPNVLTDIGQILWPSEGWADGGTTELAWLTGISNPLPTWDTLASRCDPTRSFFAKVAIYDDCRTIGVMLARSASGMLVVETGADMARRLSKGTPIEQDMIEIRRMQSYLIETEQQTPAYEDTLSAIPMEATAFFELWREGGELYARARQLEHFGVGGSPPAGWQPKDSMSLRLPEDQH